MPNAHNTQSKTEQESESPQQPSIRLPKIGMADLIKVLGIVIFIGAAWARVESGLDNLNRRLDNMERANNEYVRADVAQARNETINSKLDTANSRLERLEMKLDREESRR